MIESNRLMLQLSAFAAIALVGLGSPVTVHAAPPAKVAVSNPNLSPEQLSAQRLLLRYTQLWNMYRFRNETTMNAEQSAKVDALITAVQVPKLHADMPFDEIQKVLRTNAVELSALLKTEMAKGAAPQAAQANLTYLQGTLLKGLKNPTQYAMSDKNFRDEFSKTLADDPSLPESITVRTVPGSVAPPAMSGSGVSQ